MVAPPGRPCQAVDTGDFTPYSAPRSLRIATQRTIHSDEWSRQNVRAFCRPGLPARWLRKLRSRRLPVIATGYPERIGRLKVHRITERTERWTFSLR